MQIVRVNAKAQNMGSKLQIQFICVHTRAQTFQYQAKCLC